MIPAADIAAWYAHAPWPERAFVEQDLILSRALVEMFQRPRVAEQAVFRGGTALHKLFFQPAGRYSEDIDLVQRDAGPIGPLVNEIRDAIDPWLGEPKWKVSHGRFTLLYRFETTSLPSVRMRVKVEINTREHFTVLGLQHRELSVDNPWFTGAAPLTTCCLTELLGTKLRALYQRKKGRDLFDLWLGLQHAETDAEQLVSVFERYMAFGNQSVTRAQVEANMAAKMSSSAFLGDLLPLLRPELKYDAKVAWEQVQEAIVCKLPGEAWKGLGTLNRTALAS